MRLSEAMRLGSMLHPQGFGSFVGNLTGPIDLSTIRETCAMAAAWLASGGHSHESVAMTPVYTSRGVILPGTISTVLDVPPAWTVFLGRIVLCPASDCLGLRPGTVSDTIQHLNDRHRWTRERIADEVETWEAIESSLVASAEIAAAVPADQAPALCPRA
jgi:hypothetical protein